LLISPDARSLGVVGINDETEPHRMQVDIPAERQRFPHQIGTPLAKRVVRPVNAERAGIW
jgi:hypothetical protein